MFQVTLNHKVLMFVFSHHSTDDDPKQRGTICKLFTADGDGRKLNIAFGTTRLHPNDHYVRAEGRKHSLQKVLLNTGLNFSRADRKQIWEKFWQVENLNALKKKETRLRFAMAKIHCRRVELEEAIYEKGEEK